MNLLLLFPEELTSTQNQARLCDRRHRHIRQVLRAEVGDEIKVGLVNGALGKGRLTKIDDQCVEMDLRFDCDPPPPLPSTLILALPRPKVLKRLLQTITSFGVKKIYLLNAARVEKSYWQTPLLRPGSLLEQFLLGLEQAGDTVLPELHCQKLFKPFVEDELPTLLAGTLPLVAHPAGSDPCPASLKRPTTLAVGPEGGFVPYEIDKLMECGFRPVHLGERVLRVEAAVPALLGRMS
jgi:RsmE family RNA methyltransferase